jgi:hypothetical protein
MIIVSFRDAAIMTFLSQNRNVLSKEDKEELIAGLGKEARKVVLRFEKRKGK